MTRARDIANLVDANGDIVAGALDNVPAADLVNDTTPQLGGALDAQSNNITSVGNLGVGTASPTRVLHVDHATDATMLVNAAAGNQATYLLGEGGTSKFNMSHKASDDSFQIYNYYNNGISLKIDSSGRVTMPNQPFFSAYKNGNQALPQHYPTKLTSWTPLYNVGSGWDATNNRWTAPTAGYYLIHVCAQSNVLGGLHVRVDVNGTNGWSGDTYLDGGDVTGLNNTYFANLAANDYVEFFGYLTTAGNINANRTRFSISKVA